MTVLKIAFVIVLCIPVAYIASRLVGNLITQVSDENKAKNKNKRRMEQEEMQKTRKPIYTDGRNSSYDERRQR